MSARVTIALVGLLAVVCDIACSRTSANKYFVLKYNDRDEWATATVRSPKGEILEIECYGSMMKGTDLSNPGYRTDPNKPATWEGVVGTDKWMFGCRPLPIGWSVVMVREKYPANYLDYDTAQEEKTDTYFSHSYWKILSQK